MLKDNIRLRAFLCQPITSLRNEKLELTSLIVDNTRHIIQLSAVKLKLWVPACKIKLFQKPGFWAVSQNHQHTGRTYPCLSSQTNLVMATKFELAI